MVDEIRPVPGFEECATSSFSPIRDSLEADSAVEAQQSMSFVSSNEVAARRSCSSFTFVALFTLFFSTALAATASAQDFNSQASTNGSRASLFSRRALAKAYATGTTRTVEATQATRHQQAVDAAQVDSVAEILSSDSGSRRILGEYRGLFYLQYVRDLVGLPEIDTTDSSKLAERAAAYQSAEIFAKEVVGTALEPVYKQFMANLRWIRQYTSVRVVESGTGNVNFSSTEAKTKEPSLMEFKLHVSANNLIEPRIKFGKDVMLRYDMFHEVGVLEYNYDF